MKRLDPWRFAGLALLGVCSVLALALVATWGLLPGLVFGIVAVVVGAAIRRRVQRVDLQQSAGRPEERAMRSKCSVPAQMAVVVGVVLFVAGCAGSAGSAKPLTAAAKPEVLARYTKVALATSAQGDDASRMTPADRERIAALVARKIKELESGRFADLSSTTSDAETLHVTITFTRYDEGSAFGRFMLAGLGQIHIDADVTLEDHSLQTIIGKFEVTKTFAWGGIYGASTGIKDVEEGFAEAVAKVVLGQSSE
jgi:hypothetical protein